MKKKIYKYKLDRADIQTVMLPDSAQLLTVQVQEGDFGYKELFLWCLLDIEETIINGRQIEIIGTGNPIENENRKYISTVQDGRFVWHIFERISK